MFKVGDKIYTHPSNIVYTVLEVDYISEPIPKYKITNDQVIFWDYCFGWQKVIVPNEILTYGEILIDEQMLVPQGEIFIGCFDSIKIKIIRYDHHIFYFKLINNKIVKFKKLE